MHALFSHRFLWRGFVRFILFFLVIAAVMTGVKRIFPWSEYGILYITIKEAAATGDLTNISAREFAFTLASAMCALAVAVLGAYVFCHGFLLAMALKGVRGRVSQARDSVTFTREFPSIHDQFSAHPLLSHAWEEFSETLVPPDEKINVYRNTVRPQSFINMPMVREKLTGLKLINSIPGYFVGVGLLLTFIGLVLALNEAASAVNAADAGGMQDATRRLLQVATFKFATSIAGLGASIFLSFSFKLLQSSTENSLNRLCEVLERKLVYAAPQSITAEMNATLSEQLTELKHINSAEFFSRMGENLAPQFQTAVSTAFGPLSQRIDEAVAKLTENSVSGIKDLADSFRQSLHEEAGAEFRELANMVQNMHGALVEVQQNISSSGNAFGTQVTELLGQMQATFQQANQQVEEGLANAASSASEKLVSAISGVTERLETQIGGLAGGIERLQQDMLQQLEEAQKHATAVQSEVVATVGKASAEAARALQEGLGRALGTVRGEVERLAEALRQSAASLTEQSKSVREASDQSRVVAESFSRTAQDMRSASAPLVQAGQRISSATESMAATISQAANSLQTGQEAAKLLVEQVASHHRQLSDAWNSYSERFEDVDRSLSEAVLKLRDATQQQIELVAQFAEKIDEGFVKAVQELHRFLAGLGDSANDLSESVDNLKEALMPRAAE